LVSLRLGALVVVAPVDVVEQAARRPVTMTIVPTWAMRTERR
jgi:hypothetical protein